MAGLKDRPSRSARVFRGLSLPAVATVLSLALVSSTGPSRAETVRAAYFYDYMDLGHLDSLAKRGFNRAVIRMLGDSLNAGQARRLRAWVARGSALGIEVVPDWLLQSEARLGFMGATRRYTWGRGNREPKVACPLDTAYWRSALLDRAEEILAVVPEVQCLAFDLELYSSRRGHYDGGPCMCSECLGEYVQGEAIPAPDKAWLLSGLRSYQESRLTHFLSGLLAEFASRHRGVEIGVLDLDHESFVHQALARALARNRIPCTDYCERSYSVGGAPLTAARARLRALGLSDAALVGGLWLKPFAPESVPGAVRSINERADGYFVFTTYSLWHDPAKLTGPYTLLGRPAEYWRALEEANQVP